MARTAPLAHRQKLQQMAQTWQQLAQELRKRFAEPMRVELDGRSTGEAILAAAQSLDCDLLIKGAYTQSRLRQTIFGGATQHIMAKATMPVLLAN
jgi:nucleotide-binding universal stress UspA family protein